MSLLYNSRLVRRIHNVLVLRKHYDNQCAVYSRLMVQALKELQMNVYVEEDHWEKLKEFQTQVFTEKEESQIDLMVTIGGDGTVLYHSINIASHGMRLFQRAYSPPLLTFGRGTLGFMCVYDLNNYKQDLKQVINGNYTVECKNRIYGSLHNNDNPTTPLFEYNALNEFCISKNNYVLNLDIFINDMFVTQTRGDGLIVSTPTGSTAYSLSVGGPIVHNDVPCILISPICPLSLSFRPIVVPDSMKLSIKMSGNSKSEGTIIADGQQVTSFRQGDTLTIEKSDRQVHFIHPETEPHFVNWANKLKRLLNWNSKFTNGD